MDETKEKLNWQRLAITIGIVFVTAAAVGGTVWYLMDQNARSIADSNTKLNTELQKQISELQKASIPASAIATNSISSNGTRSASATNQTTSNTSSTVQSSSPSLQSYTNDECGFSFKYAPTYSVVKSGASNAIMSSATFDNGSNDFKASCAGIEYSQISDNSNYVVGGHSFKVVWDSSTNSATYYLLSNKGGMIAMYFSNVNGSAIPYTVLNTLTLS